MKTFYIDIGGTTLNIFYYESKNEKLVLLNKKTYKTPESNKLLFQLLKTLSNEFKEYSELIIGLPGPINSSSNKVFCPPLKYEVKLNDLKKLFIQKVLISNDVFPMALMAGNFINNQLKCKNQNSMLITIGTSFGHAFCQVNNDNKFFIDTFETAHKSISSKTYKSYIKKDFSNFSLENVNDLLSYKSYFKILDQKNLEKDNFLKFDKNSNINFQKELIDLMIIEIIEISKIHGHIDNFILKGGLASYFKTSKLLKEFIYKKFREYLGDSKKVFIDPEIEINSFSISELKNSVFSNNFWK